VQGVVQPEFVMKLIFPLAEVGMHGGSTITFDDTIYEDAIDDRADGAEYGQIQSGYTGDTYKLEYKGLRYTVHDKRRAEMEAIGIDWEAVAAEQLANKLGLRHEIQCATIAGNPATYAASNRVALSAGSRFGDAGVDPDPLIRTGKDAIADQIGLEPNVGVMGRRVFSALCTKYAKNFTSTSATNGPGLRQQLSVDDLAVIFGLRKLVICDAIRSVNGVKTKVFGNHFMMARVNEESIEASALPYRPAGNISVVKPNFGYTYVKRGHPMAYNPWYDNGTKSTHYDMDFDRQVRVTGVDGTNAAIYGYLIQNAA
jgi:hypothetical protein